ncbi:MAG: hypothetical protein P9F19_18485 [Candidatus Contendobacter sp.]|nr:hypothetical protein [Candidatus Contendobacter sp.]MDG4559356.1 hypothetical protein [Candidatus Contendobacter sp.]
MPGLWKRDRSSLIPPTNKQRKIRGGPLLDLVALQALVSNGTLGENEVWMATDSCEWALQNERWSLDDVLRMLSCLQSGDFKNAEWCQIKGGAMYPCDVYRLRYDCIRQQRNARGLEIYMKFSVDDAGQFRLVLVSCHGSR